MEVLDATIWKTSACPDRESWGGWSGDPLPRMVSVVLTRFVTLCLTPASLVGCLSSDMSRLGSQLAPSSAHLGGPDRRLFSGAGCSGEVNQFSSWTAQRTQENTERSSARARSRTCWPRAVAGTGTGSLNRARRRTGALRRLACPDRRRRSAL